jgi:hypothetical protein
MIVILICHRYKPIETEFFKYISLYCNKNNSEKLSTDIKIIERLGMVSIFATLKLNLVCRIVKELFLYCLFNFISVCQLLQISTYFVHVYIN